MKRSDAILGGAATLLGAAVYLMTLSFPKMADGAPGPALFPQILSVLMVFFGIVLVLNARHPHQEKSQRYEPVNVLKAGMVLVAIAVYIAVVQNLGFLISGTLLMASLMLMLGVRARTAVPAALVVAVGCVLLFERVLRVPLPPGFLGG